MSARTVRLDEETERVLQDLVQSTGLPEPDVVRRGLLVLRDHLAAQPHTTPFDIYKELDLGPGGYAIAPSIEVRRGVQEAVRRKIRH